MMGCAQIIKSRDELAMPASGFWLLFAATKSNIGIKSYFPCKKMQEPCCFGLNFRY